MANRPGSTPKASVRKIVSKIVDYDATTKQPAAINRRCALDRPSPRGEMQPGKDYESKIALNELYMGMAVKKGNSDLHQYLNTFIFLTRQSGELDALTHKHLSVPVGNLPVF